MGIILCFLFYDASPPWMKTDELGEALLCLTKLTPDWFPKEYEGRFCSSLLKKMLSLDPSQRPTAREAYEEFERLTVD